MLGSQDSFDRVLLNGRWIVLLSVLMTLILEHRLQFDRPSVIYVVILAGLYNAVLCFWAKKNPLEGQMRVLTLAADLAIVVGIVVLSGGIESPFFDTFYLVVISAGVQMGILGALSVAGVSFVILLATELLTASGRLTEVDHVLSTIPYLFLVALTSGYLARQLSREAESRRSAELQAKELDLARERSQRELGFAQSVQAALLPADLPVVSGLDIAARTIPAREIGGDLYDFIYRPSGSLTAAIVDVSGKGVPAALALSGLMSNLVGSRRLSPQELLSSLNHYMLEHTPEDMFATISICTIVPRRRKLYIASAGHDPIMVVRAGTGSIEMVSAEGIPLGIFGDTKFGITSIELNEGDLVVMYTDGVTDAIYGDGRLDLAGISEIICEHRNESAQSVLDALFEKLTKECVLPDDATAVIMKLVPLTEGKHYHKHTHVHNLKV